MVILNCLESILFASLKDAHFKNITIIGPFSFALMIWRLSKPPVSSSFPFSLAWPGKHWDGRGRAAGIMEGGKNSE